MTTEVNVRSVFSVTGERHVVTAQADALMDALIESTDHDVFDPAISYDAGLGLAEVSVNARGASRMDAEARALSRIAWAMGRAGIPVSELPDQRHVVELASA